MAIQMDRGDVSAKSIQARIPQVIDDIHDQLGQLEEAVTGLTNRLSVLMPNGYPVPLPDFDVDSPEQSVLAMEIEKASTRARMVTMRLMALMDAIELR